MDIVLLHGFSNMTGEKRFENFIEDIREKLPEANLIIPNYLEKYTRSELISKIKSGKKEIAYYSDFCMKKIEKERTGENLVLVCTSFGGIIARYCIEVLGLKAKAAILIGVPNKGAIIKRWEEVGIKIVKGGKPFVEQLRIGSNFLEKLNRDAEEKKPSAKYYIIAGKKDKRVPLESATGVKHETALITEGDHEGVIPSPKKDPKGYRMISDSVLNFIIKEAG